MANVYIKTAEGGETTSPVGTEGIPLDDGENSTWISINNIAEYIRTLTQILTNKTLTTPTIASFTNAQHNHSNAEGGGNLFPNDGAMLNGKISVSVASNNLTVALKTLAGTDPSASDPVYVRINGTIRSITSALSVTKNAGTNWFNAGGADFATIEVDYFVYLIWNTTPVTDVIDIGFSRIPYGSVYSDFSGTSTNAKYLANGNASAPTSTDNVVNVGRFAATLSASASYNWSVPTFTSINLKQNPTKETRWLTWNPTDSGGGLVGWSSDPASSVYQYKIIGDACFVAIRQGAAATSDSTSTTISCPIYAATVSGHIWSNTCRAIDNGGTTQFGVFQVQSAATVMDLFPTAAGGTWTATGSKRILAGEIMYQI